MYYIDMPNMLPRCHQPRIVVAQVKVSQAPVIAWCLPAAELQQVLRSHPAAGPVMDEFVDQQQKRVIWPRVSKLNMLSHTGAVGLAWLVS